MTRPASQPYQRIHIEETKTKCFYFIFTNILLEASGLCFNLSVYQICYNISPREQGKNAYRIC